MNCPDCKRAVFKIHVDGVLVFATHSAIKGASIICPGSRKPVEKKEGK